MDLAIEVNGALSLIISGHFVLENFRYDIFLSSRTCNSS